MTTEEKLKHFENSAIAKAKSLAEDMIREHQNALDKVFADHKADKDRQIALQIKTETDSIKRADNMQLSKEQIKLKRLLTQRAKELKEKLFLEVTEKLNAYRKTEDYIKLLKHQIDGIHEIAKDQEVQIYLDVEDASLLESLLAYDNAQNSSFIIAKSSFMGGTKAVIPSRHILIDNSFQTKLEEAKKEFTFNGGDADE